MKKLFCFPALELFCCLPLWKTVLFVSSRAFLLSTPTFLLSTLYKNSEATWKKATKCNKRRIENLIKNWFVYCSSKKLWSIARHVCLFVTEEILITVSRWAPDKEACPSPYHYCF